MDPEVTFYSTILRTDGYLNILKSPMKLKSNTEYSKTEVYKSLDLTVIYQSQKSKHHKVQ